MVCSTLPAPIDIPATFSGVYFNFVTGVTGTAGTGVPGWDFGVYASGGNLKFFSSTVAANSSSYLGSLDEASLLAAGPMIDGTSPALTGAVNASAFMAGVTHGCLGIVFNNESTSTINYGWASLSTTAPTGFPASVTQYCYEDDGSGIMAGTTPVSLQSYSID